MKHAFLLLIVFCVGIFSGCEKDEDQTPALQKGTMTDAEGNVYQTVKIGNQWWMAENLRTKKYRNGNTILNITDSSGWVNGSSGAWCEYENGLSQTQSPGLLYNALAVQDAAGLAPDGWHIPSDVEWQQLEQSLGMSSSEAEKKGWRGSREGEKLKVEAPQGWSEYEGVWGNNESGFTALAGSCRLPNAAFGQPGLFATGFWWTNSEAIPGEYWYRYLDYKNTNIFRSHDSMRYGFSVRCVKD